MFRTAPSTRKLPRPALVVTGERLVFAALLLVGGASAVVVKEFTARSAGPALAELSETGRVADPAGPEMPALEINDPLVESPTENTEPFGSQVVSGQEDLSVRWFNGRPVRPARTIKMLVTAYSPDEQSCAGTADGITASLHHVTTNAHKLVAADTKILPLGSMLTIPGYDSGQIVPVLDRGGKIKGNRLDVLFPTHAEALKWGARRIDVVVWEYADGAGNENWRAIRDSKR